MQARGRAGLHSSGNSPDQFPATPWLSGERLGALDTWPDVSMGAAPASACRLAARVSALLGSHRGRPGCRGLGAALAEVGIAVGFHARSSWLLAALRCSIPPIAQPAPQTISSR